MCMSSQRGILERLARARTQADSPVGYMVGKNLANPHCQVRAGVTHQQALFEIEF